MAEDIKLTKTSVFSNKPKLGSPQYIGIYDGRKLPLEKDGDTYVIDLKPVWDEINRINAKLTAAETAALELKSTLSELISLPTDSEHIEDLLRDFYQTFLNALYCSVNSGFVGLGGDATLKRISDKVESVGTAAPMTDETNLEEQLSDLTNKFNALINALQINKLNITDEEFFSREEPKPEPPRKLKLTRANAKSEITV